MAMPPTKVEQVERLMRALMMRESELQSTEETLRRTTVRRASLQAAIGDLRTTIAQLIGDEDVPAEVLARAPPEVQRLALAEHRQRADGTLLERVLGYVNGTPRMVEAPEVSQALSISVDNVRTVLSKLKARGQIARFETGTYCSLAHANKIRGEP